MVILNHIIFGSAYFTFYEPMVKYMVFIYNQIINLFGIRLIKTLCHHLVQRNITAIQ
jgi:hypothetical protein